MGDARKSRLGKEPAFDAPPKDLGQKWALLPFGLLVAETRSPSTALIKAPSPLFVALVTIFVYPLLSVHQQLHLITMSSPARRSTRSSQAGTPGRNTRSSQARSSPAAGPSDAAEAETPRRTRASQLASSPMFYESSPADGGANAAPSSPLRQMSNSQNTDNGPAPSSPLRQQTESQTINDGERTPRASGMRIGGRTSPRSLVLARVLPC